MSTTTLGIDPGTKEMGVAVLRDGRLIASGVHTLRNGDRPHDVIGQARAAILGHIRDHCPTIVAIEKPLRKATKRAALMSVIVQELHARSRELGLRVVELYPSEVRARAVGDPHAKKFAVARKLAERFPELWARLPAKPPHPVLGYGHRDKYWLHMFDALAVAVALEDPTNH
jgi:Holliday junction resolvasome RuvABC endonuclease subunit